MNVPHVKKKCHPSNIIYFSLCQYFKMQMLRARIIMSQITFKGSDFQIMFCHNVKMLVGNLCEIRHVSASSY